MNVEAQMSAMVRVRMSANDAHYGGQLVNGARMLSLFGDVATELAIICDGDRGSLRKCRVSCASICWRFH